MHEWRRFASLTTAKRSGASTCAKPSGSCAPLRAVVCDPSEVIVVNGSQQALDLIARVLVERGDRVAIEEPHYNGIREVLRAAGARLLPVPVDRDGLDPARLPAQAKMVFVTRRTSFQPA